MEFLIALLKDRRGATVVEYGLLATLISAGLIGGLELFSDGLANVFSTLLNAITTPG
ncbi:Flp family type IVb pilin [Rhizobium sp. PAMB 3174]